jgi:hypothetical protein
MNKKQTIELGITAVLVVILLLVVFSAVQRGKQKKRPAIARAATAALPADNKGSQQKVSIQDLYRMLEAESGNTKLRRDPFSTNLISYEDGTSTTLSLKGISWDNVSPLAIINDEVVRVGDNIGGRKVIEIKEDRVILNDGKGNLELKLPSQER